MYCDQCGTQLEDGQKFCTSCGKSFSDAPAAAPVPVTAPPIGPAPAGRIAGHLRILAVLWIVYSLLYLIPALGVLTLGAIGMPWMHGMHGMMFPFPRFLFFGPMIAVIGGMLALCSVIGLLAGWGLLNRKGWARVLTIVLGFLALLNIPFGTGLGIYTLWVLLPAESEREYRGLAVPT